MRFSNVPPARLPRCLFCRRQLPMPDLVDYLSGRGPVICSPRCRGPALQGPDYELEEMVERQRQVVFS
jgi:hypothetical protein